MYGIGADRINGTIHFTNLLDDSIDYYKREWYEAPKEKHRNVWTDPYYSEVMGNTLLTFSHPMTDKNGEFIGVINADIPLEMITDKLDVSKMYDDSKFMLVDPYGRIVISKDSLKQLPDTTKNFVYHGSIGHIGSQVIITVPSSVIYNRVIKSALFSGGMALIVIFIFLQIVYRSIKNTMAMQLETSNRQLMEKELNVAHDIQMGIVPDKFPAFPTRDDIDIYATMIPAKNVGGDFYDFFVRNEKLFFCIGDVSGKGIPASLLMAMTCTMFRTLSARESNPRAIVTAINNSINDLNKRKLFVTLWVAVLDLPTGLLRFCNAGHNPPVVIDCNEGIWTCKKIDMKPNIPVGIIKEYSYEAQELQLKRGQVLFTYTDGVTEAENSKLQLYGMEQMMTTLEDLKTNEPKKLVEELCKKVKSFEGTTPQSDDLTMMAINYTPQEETEEAKFTLSLENRKSEISKLKDFSEEVGQKAGVTPIEIMQINLVLEEIVTNIILYSYKQDEHGTIQIDARIYPKRLTMVVSDYGKAFDSTTLPDVDIKQHNREHKKGGLGIMLVRKLMDTVNYEYRNNTNVLTMTKLLK